MNWLIVLPALILNPTPPYRFQTCSIPPHPTLPLSYHKLANMISCPTFTILLPEANANHHSTSPPPSLLFILFHCRYWNTCTSNGYTALHWATRMNHIAVVQCLIATGAAKNLGDDQVGVPPFDSFDSS